MLEQKGKETRGQIQVKIEEINLKVLVKERRLKGYQKRVKQYRPNRTRQNN